MKHQIVFIHGGDTFDSYDEYLKFLKEFEIDVSYLEKKRWKQSLAESLGSTADVIMPEMPNKINAKYVEWKIWFEKFIPFLDSQIILIGYSLGGIFLAKYLAENELATNIQAVFLIAPPFDDKGSEYSLADFTLPASLDRLAQQVKNITIYHSNDDDVVPFADFEKYKQALPSATFKPFTDRGHFNQEEFPELIADIEHVIQSNG